MRTALLAAALAAAPALAQDATQSATSAAIQWIETDDDTVVVEPFGLNADEMEGLAVAASSGAVVGEVDDVLMRPEGRAEAVSVDLDDALGDRSVVIELASLTLDGQQLRADLSREDIEALPTYDD